MNKIFHSIVLAALLATPAATVFAQDATMATADTTDNISRVVQIFCGDGEEAEVSGSGVIIDTSLVITNAHVVVNAAGNYYSWCYGGWSDVAYAAPSEWVWLFPSDYARFDDYYDYALMYPYDDVGNLYEFDSYAILANGDSMTLAEEINILGYPATSSTITMTEGSISGFEGSSWIKTDARIDAGNSGGGAFDILGNLFGIPTSVSGYYSATLGWVQNINAILEDAFGADIAVRDFTTLFSSDNIFCFNGLCYNYAPDEGEWDAPGDVEDIVETPTPDVTVNIVEDAPADTTTSGYSIPDHAAYSAETFDSALQARLKGRILLQTQQHGEAWYVHPDDGLRYYMRDGEIAYQMMRSFGLGITDADLAKVPSVDEATEMLSVTSACTTNATAKRLAGKILLQVEQNGEAWYVHPTLCYRIYLRDGSAAYDTMRYLSLGISDADLTKLPFSSTMVFK